MLGKGAGQSCRKKPIKPKAECGEFDSLPYMEAPYNKEPVIPRFPQSAKKHFNPPMKGGINR